MPERYLSLQELLKSMGDAFVSIDETWHYRYANDQALTLLKRGKEEMLGKTVWEVFPELTATAFETYYRKVMDERIPVSFEDFHTGIGIWLEVRAYPSDNGISVFFSNTTEKKKALAIIADSERWFHSLAHNSPVMIWSTDSNNVFNYFNETWLQFTGRDINHELGEGWQQGIFEEDRHRVVKLFEEAFAQRISQKTEFRFKHHSRSYRWVSFTGNPLFGPDDTFLGFSGTCIDIHDRVMINQLMNRKISERTIELSAALEREKELNLIKSRFVSMASHEFRTPLSTILSSVGLIEQYYKLDDKGQVFRHVGRIKGSIRHMMDILNEFLSLDRLEQGVINKETTSVNLEQFIRELVDELSNSLKSEQKIVCCNNGETVVKTDLKLLHQILTNLLTNAVKYSQKDVALMVNATGEKMDISVSDQGIGIPADDQSQLFQKYFRAGNVGSIKGTGLGLTIVEHSVKLLGGAISFTSVPGKGTTFNITLPT